MYNFAKNNIKFKKFVQVHSIFSIENFFPEYYINQIIILITLTNPYWLSVYLYYSEPWEKFLVEAVTPFTKEILQTRLADQYFFIRYWEKGPHIRLRFKGNRDTLQEKVKPHIETYFNEYFSGCPSIRIEPEWIKDLPNNQKWFPNNSIQYIDYIPEINRYGGLKAIEIAEQQFQLSSDTVLNILNDIDIWTYDNALGNAILLHLGFAFALGMSIHEMKFFFNYISHKWITMVYKYDSLKTMGEIQRKNKDILDLFENNFHKQKNFLIPFHSNILSSLKKKIEFEYQWLNNWINGMSIIGDELKNKFLKNEIVFPSKFIPQKNIPISYENQYLWSIYESFIHMTNNRLGILNQDEAYLGYLIKRSLEEL